MTIKLKTYPLSVEHRGILLEGVIEYWAKDYRVILKHPRQSSSPNIHMMYMIPARFVTPLDTDKIENVHDMDIVERCTTLLKRLFDES